MLFKIKGKRENHVTEKKEGTEQGRQMKHMQFTHKVMSEKIGMDLIQSIKMSSDNFQGWGKKRRLKTKII
jgi:Txe/YoeB family toxin of Txe-Axe toxin-antitoxin module